MYENRYATQPKADFRMYPQNSNFSANHEDNKNDQDNENHPDNRKDVLGRLIAMVSIEHTLHLVLVAILNILLFTR